jgi:hypothetical protein
MNNPPLDGELVRVVQATPEEVTAFLLTLGGAREQGERWGGEKLVGLYFVLARESAQGAEGAAQYLFRKAGIEWKVIFEGGRAFYLRDTLGARYLDYLLHDPNKTISAFELEAAITPEKGEARSKDSIQPQVDARAKREYRQALDTLGEERESAGVAGDRDKVSRLDGEIEALKSALKAGDGADDTGERARANVRKALDVVMAKLSKGSREEKALGEHLQSHLSTGYECLYSQPKGRIWA